MLKENPAEIALDLRQSLVETGNKKKVKIKTLLRMFGYQKRSTANTIELTRLLGEAQIRVSPPLIRLGEEWGTTIDDWAHLEVIGADGPGGHSIRLLPRKSDRLMIEKLQLGLAMTQFGSEADVSHKFVVPLLFALGFSERDRDDQPTVQIFEGHKPRILRPDHVVYDRDQEEAAGKPLLVVEAKKKGSFDNEKKVVEAGLQAKSYSNWIDCSKFMVTDSSCILVYDSRQCLAQVGELQPLLVISCQELTRRFDDLYRICSKPSLSTGSQGLG